MRSAKQDFAVDIAALKGQLSDVLAALVTLLNATSEHEVASFTLKSFLARNHLPESQYHKLRRQGPGPRVMSVGSCGVRISRQAELDWIAAREIDAEVAARETAGAQERNERPQRGTLL
jgi:hypothetical protein